MVVSRKCCLTYRETKRTGIRGKEGRKRKEKKGKREGTGNSAKRRETWKKDGKW